MRKIRYFALFLLLPLVLTACASEVTYLYDAGTHTHVYGDYYDVTPVSCIGQGTQVRYCKICRETVTNTVAVVEDIAHRAHAFSLTVVPPTECEEGYTKKSCTLCDYMVEKADVVPARYVFFTSTEAVTIPPTGAVGALMSDTKTHILTLDAGRALSVSADLAARLAVALTVTEELSREGATLTVQSTVVLPSGVGAGNTFTVGELLCEWVANGDADIARGFATVVGGSEAAFAEKVAARLTRLGIADEVTLGVFEGSGTATLGATAVMLARALDEPILFSAFSDTVPRLIRIAGEKPVLYLTASDLRVSALKQGDTVRFLLLFGTNMPTELENTLYA